MEGDAQPDDAASSGATEPAERKVEPGPPEERRRGGRIRRPLMWLVVLVAALAAAGIGYAIYEASQSDDEVAAPPATGLDLPQNPSLRMIVEDGTLFVENDGNVTMSDVEVRDADGNPVCSLGVLSPDDREPCEEAGDAADLMVVGSGPQGQRIERGLG